MAHDSMDNGDFMARYERNMIEAQWLAQQQVTPPFDKGSGEREPEDVTGLRLLEEFLTKRRSARDGDERK